VQLISDALRVAKADIAADAELLALKPEFDKVFDRWCRERAGEPHSLSDEEWERRTEDQFELIGEIMRYLPVTREGLAFQCRAMIIHEFETWTGPVQCFIASVASVLRLDLPNHLWARLLVDDDDVEHEAV
jgi:hypothetical protein